VRSAPVQSRSFVAHPPSQLRRGRQGDGYRDDLARAPRWCALAVIAGVVNALLGSSIPARQPIADHRSLLTLSNRHGLGRGVGRGLGVGPDRGVGVGLGVAVGVALGVIVAVAVAVGVAVAVAVGVAVAVAVGVGVAVAVGVGVGPPVGVTRTK